MYIYIYVYIYIYIYIYICIYIYVYIYIYIKHTQLVRGLANNTNPVPTVRAVWRITKAIVDS